jgi:hypothetical protein
MTRLSLVGWTAIVIWMIACIVMGDHDRVLASGMSSQALPGTPGGPGAYIFCYGLNSPQKKQYFSAVYFAPADDLGQVDSIQDTKAYATFLRQKYSFPEDSGASGVECPIGGKGASMQEMEANKAKVEADVKKQNIQIIETEWKNTAPRMAVQGKQRSK